MILGAGVLVIRGDAPPLMFRDEATIADHGDRVITRVRGDIVFKVADRDLV